ncbi:hypothetical protein TWF703_000718 [Orbilia oligospora]|uniref:Bicarbonate transporter-like transmembrane domain-containing protein n=1 Tax=Orbilia oligospora TaxID=2813651 RepID=A0A7C8JK80_ORBOL|nr:hypothetical protein TWF703_000718 [Orbilia oligospora]
MEPELQKFRQRHTAGSSNAANDDAISIGSMRSNHADPDQIKKTVSGKSDNHAHAHFANGAATDGNEGGDDGDNNDLAREKTHESAYEPRNPYTYVGARGWRKYRPLRPFRGMYHDIKRRLPYYPSDFTDAFTYRAVASTIRIYFVNLLPALAYTLDMYRRTGNFYGINEGLLASALAAGVFGLFSAQPLTIGVEELVAEFDESTSGGFMGIVVAMLYFGSVYTLEKFGSGLFFNPTVRGFIADYAYPIATVFWVGFCHIPGNLKDTHVQLLPITQAFQPSTDRDWVIDFWNLDIKWVFASMPFGFLITLLFYYDHNVSSLTAQAKQYPLKKPGGFHWDFFLLGCTSFVSAVIGIPLPNGLVPQAPVHTDSLCVYQTDLQVIRTEDVEGEEIRRPKVRILKVVEQRVTHVAMALLLFGTMSRPLLVVLGTMPRTIFAGVFLTWGSIEGNGITHKVVHLLSESRFRPPDDPLHKVPSKKIALYIFLQLISVAICVAISQTVAAVGFPILICVLIPLRWVYFKRWFSESELSSMDALTADNPVVLASFGGRPEGNGGMSTGAGLTRVESAREYKERHGGAQRQRAGSFHV